MKSIKKEPEMDYFKFVRENPEAGQTLDVSELLERVKAERERKEKNRKA